MQGRVLIVEDVPEMSELVKTYLELEGLEAQAAASAEEGESILAASGFDLIILDLNLPGMDGFEFLERLRRSSRVPVMIVSARDEDEDVVSALGIGADEYLTKPFSPRALAARARALIRRDKGYSRADETRCLRFGPFELDLDAGSLRRGSERVALSAKEFSVLAYLAGEGGGRGARRRSSRLSGTGSTGTSPRWGSTSSGCAARSRRTPQPLTLLILPFFLLLVAALLSVLIARSLRLSFDRLASVATRLAAGDLDSPVEALGREDVARLGRALEELRLIMGFSHDFRTPIALIRGYAEALRDRVAPDRETEERYLDIIRDKTGQLEALVEDLLGYVRIEVDQHRGVWPRLELRAFFAALAAEFSEDASMGGRSFAIRDHATAACFARLDAGAAQRAFRNLFANAVRYTQPGGSIVLELSTGVRSLAVSLIDDGIGIAAEEFALVFEPFYRAGTSARGRARALDSPSSRASPTATAGPSAARACPLREPDSP